jgi:hypothetical protein
MTAKEEAIQLVSKMCLLDCKDKNIIIAKQCALICVDEKIEALLPYAGLLDIKKQVQELEEVKQEIKEL